MARYRCVFWGLFLSFFHLNLFGLEILPVTLALAIFTFGLYGLYNQTENRHIHLAANLSLANTLIRLAGYFILLIAYNFYDDAPSFPQYILFSVMNLFLILTLWNLFAGMREVFEPHRDQPNAAGWIAACGRGMIAAPILFTIPVILYGVLMNLTFPGFGDAERAMLAVTCCNALPILYSLTLIARYKRYLKMEAEEDEEEDADKSLPTSEKPAM